MFGVPDDIETLPPSEEDEHASRFHGLLDAPDEDDEPWPFGRNRAVFFLNERVSPERFSIRDRRLYLAMAASILLHLAIVSQLLDNSFVSRLIAASRLARSARVAVPEKEEIKPFFLSETPNRKPEPPTNRRAPLSDLDRRAHGGVGAPAEIPGSEGRAPEFRVAPPPGGQAAPRTQPGEGEDEAAKALRGRERGAAGEDAVAAPTPAPQKVADAGADAILEAPRGGASGRPPLRGLGALGSGGGAGGAVPGRRGGQVDLGPLTFDTEWYDWGPYAAEMLRRIRYHWVIPEIAQIGVGGVVRIHFSIERDGRVTNVEILWRSGHPSMDFAARDAIVNASPLPPLPPDLTGVDREGVTITFYYNTPVPADATTG